MLGRPLGQAATAWLTCCRTSRPAGTACEVTTAARAARRLRKPLPNKQQATQRLGPVQCPALHQAAAVVQPRCGNAARRRPRQPSAACGASRRQQRPWGALQLPRHRHRHILRPSQRFRSTQPRSSNGNGTRRMRMRAAAPWWLALWQGACWGRCWAVLSCCLAGAVATVTEGRHCSLDQLATTCGPAGCSFEVSQCTPALALGLFRSSHSLSSVLHAEFATCSAHACTPLLAHALGHEQHVTLHACWIRAAMPVGG